MTIVNKIEDYLRGELAGGDPVALDTAARFFRASLSRNFTAQPQEERKHLSASSPWYCARRVLYGLNGAAKVEQNPRSRLTFTMGDLVEQMGVLLTRLAGVDVVSPAADGTQAGGTLSVCGEEIRYHLDMEIRESGNVVVPVDWKSMADWGFSEFSDAILDPAHKWWTEERWGYLAQLRIYLKARGADHGYFVGVNKNTGHMAEMLVTEDPAWWEEFEGRVKYLSSARTATALPPRPSWAVSEIKPGKNKRPDGSDGPVEEVKHWRCGYCPFVGVCWEGFGLVPLKSKPVWRKAV